MYSFWDIGRGNDNIWRSCRWNVETKFGAKNTRIMWLPYGDEIMIVGRTIVCTVHECDRRIDRYTMTKTALCIASRGKNESIYTVQYCCLSWVSVALQLFGRRLSRDGTWRSYVAASRRDAHTERDCRGVGHVPRSVRLQAHCHQRHAVRSHSRPLRRSVSVHQRGSIQPWWRRARPLLLRQLSISHCHHRVKQQQQQRVAVGPGNAHCMSIRQVSLRAALTGIVVCPAAAAAPAATAALLLLLL